MNEGPQYGERAILQRAFKGKVQGILVEVGAANGITNSHTAFLIEEYDWSALLIEPLPEYYEAAKKRFENRDNVRVINKAIFNKEGPHDFWVRGQISRLYPLANAPKITVDCVRLDNLLDEIMEAKHIDFLTIDAEGADMIVLDTIDWDRWRPRVICVEHSMDKRLLRDYMGQHGYKFMEKSTGNSFFIPDGGIILD